MWLFTLWSFCEETGDTFGTLVHLFASVLAGWRVVSLWAVSFKILSDILPVRNWCSVRKKHVVHILRRCSALGKDMLPWGRKPFDRYIPFQGRLNFEKYFHIGSIGHRFPEMEKRMASHASSLSYCWCCSSQLVHAMMFFNKTPFNFNGATTITKTATLDHVNYTYVELFCLFSLSEVLFLSIKESYLGTANNEEEMHTIKFRSPYFIIFRYIKQYWISLSIFSRETVF